MKIVSERKLYSKSPPQNITTSLQRALEDNLLYEVVVTPQDLMSTLYCGVHFEVAISGLSFS